MQRFIPSFIHFIFQHIKGEYMKFNIYMEGFFIFALDFDKFQSAVIKRKILFKHRVW